MTGVSDEAVQAVLDQVRAYPWPPIPEVPDGWAYGCDGVYLKELCAHWTGAYDWRAAMADLMAVDGISESVARIVYNHFHDDAAG